MSKLTVFQISLPEAFLSFWRLLLSVSSPLCIGLVKEMSCRGRLSQRRRFLHKTLTFEHQRLVRAVKLFSHRDPSGGVAAETETGSSRLGDWVLGSGDQGRPAAAVEHRAVDHGAGSGLVIDLVVERTGAQHVGSGLHGG